MENTVITPSALIEAATRFEAKDRHREAATCRDLASKLEMYRSFKSEKQENYARSLIEWSRPKAGVKDWGDQLRIRDSTAKLGGTQGFQRVSQLFKTAREKGLKKAQIDIAVSMGEDIVPLTLKQVSPTGRNPEGTIYVSCGATKEYFGKIMPDGLFFKSEKCDQDEVAALTMFAQDPVGVSRASGRLTSNCCFCRKKLTTPESVAVGYGPSCAENFGLPWGDKKAEVNVDLRKAS